VRKVICFCISCIFSILCHSQPKDFTFPSILRSGKSINDFVPAGWKLKDSVSGYFNQEKRKDWVLVIENNDSLSIVDTNCYSDQPFYAKMLIAIVKQSENAYQVSSIATKIFGKCNWGIQGSDPYVSLSKRGNSFAIAFSDGGTLRNLYTYYFRFQQEEWFLIGASQINYWAGHPGAYFEDLDLISGVKHEVERNKPFGKDISIKKFYFKPLPLNKLIEFTPETELPFTSEHG
jgi:hypothetical protein